MPIAGNGGGNDESAVVMNALHCIHRANPLSGEWSGLANAAAAVTVLVTHPNELPM